MRVRISRAHQQREIAFVTEHTHTQNHNSMRAEKKVSKELSGASSTNANVNIFTQLQSIKQTKELK
jgi:hypothetical protein